MTTDAIIASVIARETGGKAWAAARAARQAADRGGWTRGGITATTWGAYRKLGRQATPAELDAISEPEAVAFYDDRYVAPYREVPDPLRALLVDWAVTSWHDDPTKALQASLKARGIYDGAVDGVVGLKTRAAIVRDPDPRQTYRDVFKGRVQYMRRIAFDADVRDFLRTHPTSQLNNLSGWLNRTLEFCP